MSIDISVADAGEKEITKTLKEHSHELINDIWHKALGRIKLYDFDGAISAAKTLIETVCMHILIESGNADKIKDDMKLPALYHATASVLNLAPNQQDEKMFASLLGHCQEVVKGVNEVRNRYGGDHPNRILGFDAEWMHATMAVNLAGTMSTFLLRAFQSQWKVIPDRSDSSKIVIDNMPAPYTPVEPKIEDYFYGFWKSKFKFSNGMNAKVDYIEIRNENQWFENGIHVFNIDGFEVNEETNSLKFTKVSVSDGHTLRNILMMNPDRTIYSGKENDKVEISYHKLV